MTLIRCSLINVNSNDNINYRINLKKLNNKQKINVEVININNLESKGPPILLRKGFTKVTLETKMVSSTSFLTPELLGIPQSLGDLGYSPISRGAY